MKVCVLVSGVAGLASAVGAQTPSFFYAVQVPAWPPGQTVTVTVLCGFSPGIGGTVTTPFGPGTVLGLSSGAFNIMGDSGPWSQNTLIAPYNFLGSPGIIAGTNIIGAVWGNGFAPPLGQVSTLNPAPLWMATFTVPAVGQFSVNPVGSHGVWVDVGQPFAIEILSSQTFGAHVVFFPAPSAAAPIVAVLAHSVYRRRRRTGGDAHLAAHRAISTLTDPPS